MKPTFSESVLKEVDEILPRYPTRRAALLPVLHIAQREFGWVSRDTMTYVGELLELPFSEVYDTVTFYSMFKLKPMGKYHLQVCHTLSCALRGASDLCKHIKEKYAIEHGEVSADGKFSMVKVECLASCGTAPVVQINDDYHEGLSLEKFDQLLDSLE